MRPGEPRYTILDLLGEGGFGRVYRARMDGPDGFTKDVAVKLLRDARPPQELLARFRDESRMLALVRDRAVVRVDPPIQLHGRWAIVMEYVDGASCSDLLRRVGVLPTTVALEVVTEVARALDSVHHQLGPDGRPLHLLHRDVKPSNLALTANGEVKLLDFGNAKATFEARESRTTSEVAGSFGYLAPERLSGIDVAAGDVYSLGGTLRRLIVDRRSDDMPHREDPLLLSHDPAVHRALELVRAMTAPDPDQRPTCRQVEQRCEALRRELTGPSLRDWAYENVPPALGRGRDELVGSVLSHSSTLSGTGPSALASRTRALVYVAGLGSLPLLGAAIALLAAGALAAVGLAVTRGVTEPAASDAVGALEAEALEAEALEAEALEAEALEAAVPDAEAPGPDEPAPPPPVPEPGPAPAAHRPPRPPAGPRADRPVDPVVVACDVGSVPLGARVTLDGAPLGVTPLFGVALPAGRHTLGMQSGAGRSERAIDVVAGAPRRWIWKGGDTWTEGPR